MHAREVQINHKRPYTGGRDLSCKIPVFALRDKRSLSATAGAGIAIATGTAKNASNSWIMRCKVATRD
jgi:hypothetical protein